VRRLEAGLESGYGGWLHTSVFGARGGRIAQFAKFLEGAGVYAEALLLRFRVEGVVERLDLDDVGTLKG
jgi:hypothetical protein